MITLNGLRKKLTNAFSTDTPARRDDETPSFQSEKSEIRSCNNRLERYVSLQKTRDTKIVQLEKLVQGLRGNLTSEKERIRRSVKKSFDKIRDEKNSFESDFLETRAINEKLQSELKSSTAELKTKRNALNDSEKKLFDLYKKREKERLEMEKLTTRVNKLTAESSKAADQVASLQKERGDLREERNVLQKKYTTLRNAHQKKKADQQFSDKTYKEMVSSYEKEISQIKEKMDDVESDLQEQFEERLKQSINERQKSLESVRERSISDLTKAHSIKLSNARDELEDSKERSDSLEASLASAELKAERAESKRDLAVHNLEHQKKQTAELEKRIHALKLKPIRKDKHNADALKLMKEAFRKQEIEIERLLELKMSLTVEIKSYRDILDKEDIRTKSIDRRFSRSSRLSKTETISENTVSLKELQKELVEETTRTKKTQKTQKKEKKEKKEQKVKSETSREKRRTRSRRSSGRPEGVLASPKKRLKKQSPATPEAETPGMDCVFECYGHPGRIEIKNKSSEAIPLENWALTKSTQSKASDRISFPSSLKSNESFFVYPSKQLMAEDKSQGVKKVWNQGAFSEEAGSIAILNDSGVEMYRFDISPAGDD